ncbi:hypothetical protein IAT38_006298 [Cryptococcus sp. DSM 104549]
MSPSITLHHLNVSRSERLFWALEELKLPYDVQVHFRLPTRSAPPSLFKVSPLGRAPALILDGNLVIESAFIIHTLLALPEVKQAAEKGEIDVQVENTPDDVFWSHFAEGSMMTLLQAGAMSGGTAAVWTSGQVPNVSDEEKEGIKKYSGWFQEQYLKPNIQNILDYTENFLSKHDYFSGTNKPGQGDFLMFFAINSLLAGGRKDAGFKLGPGIHKWHERVLARPAAQKALQRLKEEEEKAKAKI